jgi:Zn-dependent protease with chaperone function
MDRSRRTTPKVRHPQGGASPDPSSSGIPAQATGHDYIVLANELFANLYNGNRNGLRFIIGHELGHIRFHHVALWYQLAVAYSSSSRCSGRRCRGCGSTPVTGRVLR